MNLIKKYQIFLLSVIYFFYKEIHSLIIDRINIIKNFFFSNSKKNIFFQNFLKSNLNLFKDLNFSKKKNSILVDTVMGHPGYICTQLIIAKFIQKITGDNMVILNRKKNSLITSVGKSYNINNYLYLEKSIFIQRFFNFLGLMLNIIKINDITSTVIID